MDQLECVACGQRYRADGSTQNPIDASVAPKAADAESKPARTLLLFGRDVSPADMAKAINAERDRQLALIDAGIDPGTSGYLAWKKARIKEAGPSSQDDSLGQPHDGQREHQD
jgi:hypothetical protein